VGAYILRRLALVVPTLLGIMLINFLVIQLLPGGPVERVISELTHAAGSATDRFSGGGGDAAHAQSSQASGSGESAYRGAQGLDPEFIKDLEKQFGFDKPAHERFLLMLRNYATFDFGESYFRSISVIDLILEKMPVSISLGLWTTLLSYLISIPLGVRKAVRDGSRFDVWTSAAIIVGYAIPGFLFAVLLLVFFAGGSYVQWFPLRGLLSDGLSASTCVPLHFTGWLWGFVPTWTGNAAFQPIQCATEVIPDYLWHMVLPVAAMSVSGFATLTLLTKNSFLDEIKKQYVLTARAKGLTERRVLYRHVFRNAMLIVVAGFPAAFVSIFFTGSLLIEVIFSLDGLGLLGFEAALNRDYPVFFGTLYIFGLMGLLIGIISDLTYVWIDPRIDFESREA
jgi:microcin C transport system permease protein